MFDLIFSARGLPTTTTVRLERSEPGQAEVDEVLAVSTKSRSSRSCISGLATVVMARVEGQRGPSLIAALREDLRLETIDQCW